MNNRIKELLNQAGGEFYEGFAGSTNFVKFAEDDFEKFAELIVRDCATKANAIAIDLRIHPELVHARTYVGDGILKLFGVEE
jgi:hypothetical protein